MVVFSLLIKFSGFIDRIEEYYWPLPSDNPEFVDGEEPLTEQPPVEGEP